MTDQPPRRLRTQAERDADGQAWRATAATRPGYATYPQTLPGSPSWWLRYGGPEIHHHAPARPPHLGPPPVDGETCKRWCGFCHLGTEPTPDNSPVTGDLPEPPRPDIDLTWEPTGFITIAEARRWWDRWLPLPAPIPPRRRWWHRYTRPTRKD